MLRRTGDLRVQMWMLLSVVMLLSASTTYAQQSDPLVGAWNLTFSSDGTVAEIAVMTFNSGGTTAEFDTAGTNSSASPGESVTLGTWENGSQGYEFKGENYIYDGSGNLSDLAVGDCHLKLAANQREFEGNCTANFYTCSLSQCPGTLVTSVPIQVSGKRFGAFKK